MRVAFHGERTVMLSFAAAVPRSPHLDVDAATVASEAHQENPEVHVAEKIQDKFFLETIMIVPQVEVEHSVDVSAGPGMYIYIYMYYIFGCCTCESTMNEVFPSGFWNRW